MELAQIALTTKGPIPQAEFADQTLAPLHKSIKLMAHALTVPHTKDQILMQAHVSKTHVLEEKFYLRQVIVKIVLTIHTQILID